MEALFKLILFNRVAVVFAVAIFALAQGYAFAQNDGQQDVLAKGGAISLNNMETPKLTLHYSAEEPKANDTLYLSIAIPEGWHINADKVLDEFLVPTSVEPEAVGIEFYPPIFPQPHKTYNEVLGISLLLLQGEFSVAIPIKEIDDNFDPYQARVKLTYQACSNICLAPRTIEASFNSLSGTVIDLERDARQNLLKKNSNEDEIAANISNQQSADKIRNVSRKEHIIFFIVSAIMGGLLLNVMPCVLPILFLKVFDFMHRSGNSRKKMFKWGLATASGIFFSFAALAVLITLLRLGGTAIGWGFQFQHAVFTASMAMLIGALTLNMWGIYEIWLPGKVMNAWDKQTQKGGFLSAFAYGALLVLLSTPCSAPFLGPAIGFAFAAEISELWIIFGSVAFGLSIPYLALGAFPQWTKFLPKPGKWMERVKQFLGFPLLFTVIWLFWIFFKQTGWDATLSLGILLGFVGFVAWISGIWATPGKSWLRFGFLWTGLLAAYIITWNFLISPQIADIEFLKKMKTENEEWGEFSLAKLDSLQKEGSAIWINGMADWCITCKMNEKQVFNNAKVQMAFIKNEVVRLQADYTRPNYEASTIFEKYGRSAVPFDLLITSNGNAILMPEILTTDTVLKALEQAWE